MLCNCWPPETSRRPGLAKGWPPPSPPSFPDAVQAGEELCFDYGDGHQLDDLSSDSDDEDAEQHA